MLTNFVTIRKAVKKMSAIDRTKEDGTFETLSTIDTAEPLLGIFTLDIINAKTLLL